MRIAGSWSRNAVRGAAGIVSRRHQTASGSSASTQVESIVRRMQDPRHSRAVGNTLEIAVYRALVLERASHRLSFFGAFHGLESSSLEGWSKEEPPSTISGRSLPGDKKIDFALIHPAAGPAGVEVKNIREWIYPDSEAMRELLGKCCALDAVL